MKEKYIFFTFLGACCAAHGVENTDCETSRQAYSGFYAGAGISYQQDHNDVKCSDNLGDVSRRHHWKPEKNANGLKLNQQKENKFGGSLNFGYGKLFGAGYLGLDADVDISGNKESEKRDDVYGITKVKTQGVVPTLALRIGAHIAPIDVLACVRAGIAYVDSKVKMDDEWKLEWKVKKVTPVIGLSLEKMVTKKFALKLEYDYRFKAKGNFSGTYPEISKRAPEYKINVNSRMHGHSVRLVGVYHF